MENLKSCKELYPDWEEGYGPGNYQPIIDSFGEVLLQVDDSDYQGDSRIIYRNGNAYGWLIFGWGSCSGCDALQACQTEKDVNELIQSLSQQIKWYDSLSALQEYFKNKDWETEFSWSSDETKNFVSQTLNLKP